MAQTLTGLMASIACIVIHAAVMTVVVRVAQLVSAKAAAWPSLVLIAIMVATVSVLMIAHLREVLVWARADAIVGADPAVAAVLDLVFVYSATLVSRDVTPVARLA